MLFAILKILEEHQQAQHLTVRINWFAPQDNEQLLEEGQMFKEDFPTLPFEFIIPKMVA